MASLAAATSTTTTASSSSSSRTKTTTTTPAGAAAAAAAVPPLEFPGSVEEAAALLGATITRCGGGFTSSNTNNNHETAGVVLPPAGMHPAFAVVTTNNSTELLHRLYALRSMLRTVAAENANNNNNANANTNRNTINADHLQTSAKKTKPGPLLPSAPSILQVLKKLLGISTQLVAAAAAAPPVLPVSSGGGTSGGGGGSTIIGSSGSSSADHPANGAATSGSGSSSGSSSSATAAALLLLLKHNKHRETPPMWSTPCRLLWVDCVVLCHALSCSSSSGSGSTGGGSSSSSSSQEVTQFVRQMLGLASIHPRSAKAAGGVRIAALSVTAALLEHEDNNNNNKNGSMGNTNFVLASQLAPWSLDILQVCLKALRSAGNGEPTFREAAIRAACATATACRNAAMKNRRDKATITGISTNAGGTAEGAAEHCKEALLLPGAMEDKAVVESIKVLKQAVTDKFPEVRSVAATFAGVLAPILVPHHHASFHSSTPTHSDPLAGLEEVLQLALRNLDDEFPVVAAEWAEAAARCMSTAIQYNEALKAAAASQERGDAGGGSDSASVTTTSTATTTSTSAVRGFGSRISNKSPAGLVHTLTTVKKAVDFLVHQFVKAGGELAASRAGGTFSVGGRAVRLGYCLTLIRLLRLQSAVAAIGESRSISMRSTIVSVLGMVGTEIDEQLKAAVSATRTWSKADAGLVRLFTSRVLRHGLSELAAEMTQISILQELIGLLPSDGERTKESASTPSGSSSSVEQQLNANQLKVVLIEISHLLATLGEAGASRVEELLTKLQLCLSHANGGVRHEAAVACVALAESFPSEGRTLIVVSVEVIQLEIAGLVAAAAAGSVKHDEAKVGLGMFRRPAKDSKLPTDTSRSHEFAIHGRALLVSMLVKDLPKLPGGLSRATLGSVLTVAEILVSSQFNEVLTSWNAEAVCSCVRAGFGMISGALATGPGGVDSHMPLIVGTWQKAGKAAKEGGKNLALHHDLVCLDAVLSSIVAFLKLCTELLLAIPEALSNVTVLLEDMFPLLQPNGRLGNIPSDPMVAGRLESSTASLMEAFAWLPSGSFPLVADEVFWCAAGHIRMAVEGHVTCSVLHSLVAKEDSILDSKPLSRANRVGQVGGARDIEETIIALTGEVALHSERESVLHLRSDEQVRMLGETPAAFRGSSILELFASDTKVDKPPTPLHEVGTWRRPLDPSCSTKVRKVDAAIQAFSATFGLKDGKEQQGAMDLLESLVPLAQVARTIGINAASAENERRAKTREDGAAVANITAVLLSCLQALPLHEATHNVPIGLGPPWMNKAKDLLLTLLPSASTIVRRAAAEGLALLATLGVTEDAHFLQSSLLHSLDEVMQGNKPDGKARALALEPVSAARAGSLLTLACIQRTAHNVAQRKRARARERGFGSKTDEAVDKSNENLPVLQMMTRILPSAACHGFRDYFAVKTYALHAFAVLLIYSVRLKAMALGDEDKQLLRKGIELVEDNFSSSWTAASIDIDKGQEAEKLISEVTFLAVLLRLMTFLLPFLHHLQAEDRDIARRFSVMATLILERHCSHQVIALESMAFFEVLAMNLQLLPPPSKRVTYSENPMFSCIPSVLATLTPNRPALPVRGVWQPGCLISSGKSFRAAVYLATLIQCSHISVAQGNNMMVVSLLVASLEAVSGSRHFNGGNLLRSVAAGREVERFSTEGMALEREIFQSVFALLLHDSSIGASSDERLLRWILFSRQLLSRFSSEDVATETTCYTRGDVMASAIARAESDGAVIYETANPVRWQVKCVAAQIGAESLRQLIASERQAGVDIRQSPNFDLTTANSVCASACSEAADKDNGMPGSRIIFHLEDILASACLSSVATLDQAELLTLQENAMHLLRRLVECFGPIADPEDPTGSILHQHSTQIFSSVKHALASPEESDSASSSRLFVAGCETLSCIIKTGVTSDPMVVTRLIRPTVLPTESLPVLSYCDEYRAQLLQDGEKNALANTRATLAVRIGSIWTVGSLLLARQTDLQMEYLHDVAKVLIKDELGLALYSAAAAIDSCHLLYSSNLTLAGLAQDMEETRSAHDGGFHYRNENDLDDFVKSLLARTWSQCSIGAVQALLEAHVSEENDHDRREICASWIKALVPLLLAGVYDGVKATATVDHAEETVEWVRGIDFSLLLKDCLCGISLIVRNAPKSWLDGDFGGELERIVELLFEFILLPTLGVQESQEEAKSCFEPSLVSAVCSFIQTLAQSNAEIFPQDSVLLVCLLQPLHQLQSGNVKFGDGRVEEVIATCLSSVVSLIRRGPPAESLVKAMLHLSMNTVLSLDFASPPKVRDAGKTVLRECLDHNSVTLIDREKIAAQLASSGNWEGWAVAATLNSGIAIVKSLEIIQEVLHDPNKSDSHLSALAAIRLVVQNAHTPVIGRMLHGIGADIVGTLYQYGTMKVPEAARSNRTAVCADAMKIILVAYQVSTEDSEEKVSSFLAVVFETLLAILRFNGLPNHASPEPLGDAVLGRMSAQAILHVARSSPAPFKSCVASLSDHERTLLEFAVRAEMSGYAVASQQQEPTKKKLSLKGFKK